jgi:hypothetical protein
LADFPSRQDAFFEIVVVCGCRLRHAGMMDRPRCSVISDIAPRKRIAKIGICRAALDGSLAGQKLGCTRRKK